MLDIANDCDIMGISRAATSRMEMEMQIESRTLFEVDQELDRMKFACKGSSYPQIHRIMGHIVCCEMTKTGAIVFDFDGITIARKGLAQMIVANAK